MAKWASYTDGDGKVYSLHHFHDQLHTYRLPPTVKRPKARDVVVRVTFGIHCFTRKAYADEVVNPHQIYCRNSEGRLFCATRWEWGKNLPEILDTLLDKKCFETDRRNHVLFSSAHTAGGDEYALFFVLRAASQSAEQDAKMMVLSAHSRKGFRPPGRPDSFRFLLARVV